MGHAYAVADKARHALGFSSIEETAALADRGIVILDPLSTLISAAVDIAPGAILWPGVILHTRQGSLTVGPETILFPGTRIVAAEGSVRIGTQAEIGEEGGFTIKAESGSVIEIGDGARLLGGGSLILSNRIGAGAQIIGPIRCQNCRLGDGGTHREPDPDRRGGVLKGSGVARNVDVPQGHVIQAFGLFADGTMHRQSHFHPKSR